MEMAVLLGTSISHVVYWGLLASQAAPRIQDSFVEGADGREGMALA